MAEKLAAEGHEVVLLDNASTYQPLLDWYKTCPYRVVHAGANIGHVAPWYVLRDEMATQPFVITDPDLDISGVPRDWPKMLQRAIDETGIPKAGFDLEILLDRPDYIDDRHGPRIERERERRPWKYDRVCALHDFKLDTSFSLHAPGTDYDLIGVRLGPPYIARHLPEWAIAGVTPVPPDVDYYFRNTGKSTTILSIPSAATFAASLKESSNVPDVLDVPQLRQPRSAFGVLTSMVRDLRRAWQEGWRRLQGSKP
jgi:hypothetical protein